MAPAVVLLLALSATARRNDRARHGAGHGIGVQDCPTVFVPSGAADHLEQRSVIAKESLPVGLENGNQGHHRQIDAFAQQVATDN